MLEGSNVSRLEVAVSKTLGVVFSQIWRILKHIAFDVEKRRLHWTAADGIWSIYTDNDAGIPRRLGKEDLDKVRGIAVFDDVVYWTEQKNGLGSSQVYVNRNGSGDKKLLAVLEEIIPGGIAVDPVGGKVYWTTSHGIQNAPLTGETVVIRAELSLLASL